MIAATVIFSGIYLIKIKSQVNIIQCANFLCGILFVTTGLTLYAFNAIQAIGATLKLKIKFIPYLIISIVILFSSSTLLYALIAQKS